MGINTFQKWKANHNTKQLILKNDKKFEHVKIKATIAFFLVQFSILCLLVDGRKYMTRITKEQEKGLES